MKIINKGKFISSKSLNDINTALSNNSKIIYFTYVFPTHPIFKPSAYKCPFFGIRGQTPPLKPP